jgi:arylsulfatase A-like enzyme
VATSPIDALRETTPWPNVVLITLDCCRFDTAGLARTPLMDSIGPLRQAVTPGTFTLPAHMAFFSGYLPQVRELPLTDYYSREAQQLWRLSRAKSKARTSYWMHLEGDTLWEGFRRAGYRLIGAGGVRWFLTKTLTNGFDEFIFRGPDDYSDWFRDRTPDDFVLGSPGRIVDAVDRANGHPWFLFINCLETHAPYDDGTQPLSPAVREIITRAEPIWAGRRQRELEVDVTREEFRLLHQQQVRALETVDARLATLFEALPKPFLVVITGDHGECFGEGGLWGHGFPAEPVLHVPLVVGPVLG